MENLILYKGRGGLYSKFLERLYFTWKNIPINSRKQYLSYTDFRTNIPRSFQINIYHAKEILAILADLGFVELKKRGIILNFEVKEK